MSDKVQLDDMRGAKNIGTGLLISLCLHIRSHSIGPFIPSKMRKMYIQSSLLPVLECRTINMVNIQGDQCQCAYNTEEHAVINVHKASYLEMTSAGDRKTVTQKVLVDIFNHWYEKEMIFTDIETTIRTKVCEVSSYIFVTYSLSRHWWPGFRTTGNLIGLPARQLVAYG